MIILCALNATAQNEYTLYSYIEKDGLASNSITDIAEDGNGFIWIGSSSGLMFYDGYSFRIINSGNDSLSLHGNYINDLDTDANGNIWIASESCVCKYDILSETFTPYKSQIDGKIESCYQANILFMMHNGKIRYYASRMFELDTIAHRFVPIQDEVYLPHHIRQCYHCKDDKFLAISIEEKMIYYIDSEGHEIAHISCENTPFGRTTDMLELGDGKFYIASDNGLIKADFQAKTIKKIDRVGNYIMPTQIATIYLDDSTSELWIGTNAEELHIISANRKKLSVIPSDETHTSSQKLNSSTVLKIFRDSRNLIWLGTWHGLSIMDTNRKKQFRNLIFPECGNILPSCTISGIDENRNGLLAISTDGGGIAFWNKKSSRHTDIKDNHSNDNMPNLSVLTIAYDSKGNLYNGGYMHQLHRYSPDRQSDEVYPYDPDDPDALHCNFITKILVENDTTIWVLTNGSGLSLFNPNTKKFKHIIVDKNGVKPCSPYGICMTLNNEGNIIVGTYEGLFIYNHQQNTVRNYQHNDMTANSLSHNWVYSIYTDSEGLIWVGTCSGLDLFDPETETFTVYDQDAGFSNTVCSAILEDDNRNLWIATSNGIAKFSIEQRKVTRKYDKSDGLLTSNFTKCSYFKDRAGTFYFGTSSGLAYFHPDKILPNHKVEKPLITRLLIDYKTSTPNTPGSPLSKSMSRVNNITLTSEQSTFTLQYASPAYPDASSYTYEYRILGDDKGWLNKGRRREIDFPNTAPGIYKIALVARNTDGAKSEPTYLTVTVLPPWYKTIMAQIAMAATVILIITLIVRQRFRNLKLQKQKLEDEVKQRTQEIRKANIMLEQRNQELNQSAEEIKSQRDMLSEQNQKLENALFTIKSKNFAIQGSITYAQTIITALLTKETEFYQIFDTAYILKPKDIISGDFFWLKNIETESAQMVFVADIDCTGHGVPGAFMSIIANAVLNEIVETDHIYQPCEIISELSYRISKMLEQEYSNNKDGMDMALCRFNREADGPFHSMIFSGAKIPIYIRRASDAEYAMIKGDRKSVAGGVRNDEPLEKKIYQECKLEIQKGDTIYMSSDGILDMANPERKRFSRTRFLELINRIYPLEMDCQAVEIEKEIANFAQDTEQRDDISVLGLRF